MSEEINSDVEDEFIIYKMFPFLLSFPFSEYVISFDKLVPKNDIDIDPLIAKESGDWGSLDFINFTIPEVDGDIIFSFYTFDIEFITSMSKKVRKLDSIREKLDIGLNSELLSEKAESIKIGEKFIKKIGPSLLASTAFDPIVDGIISANKLDVSPVTVKKIKKIKIIDEKELSKELYDVISSFYDLHIHHIKILLGIVISHKIH
tara:strand:+ start:8189 stop:8803 length:615 start_codon:yes stop_codon:yes gene_type:complete